jgi:hypothetical protein
MGGGKGLRNSGIEALRSSWKLEFGEKAKRLKS